MGSISAGSSNRPKPLVEIDLEIFSMFIISLPLIQEGQLSVSRERLCTCTGSCSSVITDNDQSESAV